MERLISEIKQKEKELDVLRTQLNDLGKNKFQYLINKFYKLSATEFIKVTGINYVEDSNVDLECIKITGGKYNSGNFVFNINENYSIYFSVIEDDELIEVSKKRFIEFLNECIKETKKVALELS